MRLVQITDIHLFADKRGSLLGVETLESFSAVLQLLKNDPKKPDAIILSGDVSQDNSKESYRHLLHALECLDTVPIYFVPGNHDDAQLMSSMLPSKMISNLKQVILNNWNVILLNSQLPGYVKGHLDKSQIDFLVKSLEKHSDHPAMVVFHHQPIPVGSEWLDQYIITNAAELWDTIAAFPQLKIILFGHVHQVMEGQKQGVHFYSAPATCIQFKPKQNDFGLDNIPQGYRWIELEADGKWQTGVCRLDNYVGKFNPNAQGY